MLSAACSAAVAVALGAVVPEPLKLLGAGAGILTVVGALLLVPLFLAQRRDLQRLERWRELEPQRGDEGAPLGPATADRPEAGEAGAAAGRAGPWSRVGPAERVTLERPALERITAERAALDSPSRWRRLLARGPRHPLLLSAGAVVAAVTAVIALAMILDPTGERIEPGPTGAVVPEEVDVAVLNASSVPELAEKVADDVEAASFAVVQVGETDRSRQTVVMYARGARRAARAVARELGGSVVQPLDRALQPAVGDADVVVLAGEDRARA